MTIMDVIFRLLALLFCAALCRAVTLDDIDAKLNAMQAKIDRLEAKIDLQSIQQLESEVNDVTFFSSTGCASATPAASLPLAAIAGVPNGVSGRAQCALHCENLDGCKAYNHRSVAKADGTQCELYKSIPGPLEFADSAGCTFYRGTELIDRPTILVQQNDGQGTMFQKTWAEYKTGFGDKTGNYWIGNDRLHALTMGGRYKMKIRMQSAKNQQWYWAEYSVFIVGSEVELYQLTVGGYSGTAGDGMNTHTGMKFSTADRDNDLSSSNCAADSNGGKGGGYWYSACFWNSINALGGPGTYNFAWYGLPVGSTAWSDMKLLYTRVTLVRM